MNATAAARAEDTAYLRADPSEIRNAVADLPALV